MNTTVYVARVDTRYEITAVALTAEEAIITASEYALKWLAQNGVSRFTTVDEVRDHFGVCAFAIPVGTAVDTASAKYFD